MENIIDDDRYNKADFFITPDRKCEQFLFQRGIRFMDTIKGETMWTYWVYPRTDTLKQAIEDYKAHLVHRRSMARSWSVSKSATDSPVIA